MSDRPLSDGVRMKNLAIAMLLCSGPAWGQSAERSMVWHDLAFRTGFKAAAAQACADLTAPEFADIQAEFDTETRDLGLVYGEAYAKMLSDGSGIGTVLPRGGVR